jgi:antirestriction protein ArdC
MKIRTLKDQLDLYKGSLSEEDLAVATALFDGYSPNNALLIAMQRPTATDVRGFKEWLDHGRVVRKGEKGIAIFAPVTRRLSDDERQDGDPEDARKLVNVKIAWVFDVTQTDELEIPPENRTDLWPGGYPR